MKRLAMLAGALGAVAIGASAFEVGRRWPIEFITERLSPRVPVTYPGWATFATTDLPRYEMLRLRVGRQLFLFGGFHGSATLASARVDVLDLETGAWSRRADLPVALTHTTATLVGDTVWIAGGFEGNHPGPATQRVWRYAMRTDAWSSGPPLPAARGGGALVAVGSILHFVGGYLPDRNTDSPDHWTLTPGDTVWRVAAPLPVPRGHLAAVAMEGKLYAIGGTSGHDPTPVDLSNVHRYDPTTDRWEELPPVPVALSHIEPATTVVGGGILVVGGRSRPTARENMSDMFLFEPSRSVWRYVGATPVPMLGGLAEAVGDSIFAGMGAAVGNNPETTQIWRAGLHDQWRPMAAMPYALGEVAAGVVDGSLIVVGEGSAATFALDLGSGMWRALVGAVRPAPGNHHAAEVVGDSLLLIGGLDRDAEGLLQIFDTRTQRWSLGPRMPFAAGASASARIGGSVYVAGGLVKNSTVGEAAALDLDRMAWHRIAPMPLPRNHAASGTDGERLYVFGGRGPGSGNANEVANGFDEVQVYDPRTDSWIVSSPAPGTPLRMPRARGGTGKAVYVNGEFWVLGGETLDGPGATREGVYDRVDIYDPVRNSWRPGPPMLVARHGIFPVMHEGRILVAGGGMQAGHAGSSVAEMFWPRGKTP